MNPYLKYLIKYIFWSITIVIAMPFWVWAGSYNFSGWDQDASGYNYGFSKTKSQNAPMILYFRVTWCRYCKQLENNILTNYRVDSFLGRLEKVMVNPETGVDERKIANQYHVTGYPTFLVLLPNYQTQPKRISHSHKSPEAFIKSVENAITSQYNRAGLDLRRQKQFQAAADCFEKGLEFDQQDLSLLYNMAANYHDWAVTRKDYAMLDKARIYYQKVLDIDPSHKNSQKAIKQIDTFLQQSKGQKQVAKPGSKPDSDSHARQENSSEALTRQNTRSPESSHLVSASRDDGKCAQGNCKYGKGTFNMKNGDRYSGEFADGYFNGNGTYTFADGSQYNGHFLNNSFNGQGTFTFTDGRKYIGQFRNDRFSGEGTMVFPDGSEYLGNFKNDKSIGRGILYYPDGSSKRGRLRNGKFIPD